MEHSFSMEMHYWLLNFNLKSGLPIGYFWGKTNREKFTWTKNERSHQRPIFFSFFYLSFLTLILLQAYIIFSALRRSSQDLWESSHSKISGYHNDITYVKFASGIKNINFGVFFTHTPMCVNSTVYSVLSRVLWKKYHRHATRIGFEPTTLAILEVARGSSNPMFWQRVLQQEMLNLHRV